MSVTRMMQRAIVDNPPSDEGTPPSTPEKPSAVDTIATYIPSEILAVYVMMLGTIRPEPADRYTQWILFWVAVALLAFHITLTYILESRKSPGDKIEHGKTRSVAVFVMAVAAFTAYVATLPDNPFLQWHSNASAFGAVAAGILAVFLPMLGQLFALKKDPKEPPQEAIGEIPKPAQ